MTRFYVIVGGREVVGFYPDHDSAVEVGKRLAEREGKSSTIARAITEVLPAGVVVRPL